MRYLLPVLMLIPFSLQAAEGLLRVEDAWVREAPPGVTVLGGYLRLCNHSAVDVTLTSVESEDFGRIEMHETIETESATRMERIKSLAVPAGKCVEFVPGGKHLMLFDPVKPVRDGDFVTLQFVFAPSDSLETRVPVRRGNNNNKEHHHHGH